MIHRCRKWQIAKKQSRYTTLHTPHLSFHLFILISNTAEYIFSFLSFYWMHHASGCLLHSWLVEEEWHFSTVTKDDSTSRAHNPPWACCICLLWSTELEANICFALETTFDLRAETFCQINEERGSFQTRRLKL